MKTKLVLTIFLSSFLFINGCSNNNENVQEAISETQLASRNGGSVINQEYPDAQAEVLKNFTAIATSITNGAGLGADSDL